MANFPEHETAVDIIARALATVPANERPEALRNFEARAAADGNLASIRALKRYRAVHYPTVPGSDRTH